MNSITSYIILSIILILFIIIPSFFYLCKSCNKSIRNIEIINKEKEEEDTEYLLRV